MERYEQLRKDEEAFCYMIETFAPPILGKLFYKKMVSKKEISSFLTVSDEAFILLILKNNELVWPVHAKIKACRKKNSGTNCKEKDVPPVPRYTNKRQTSGQSNRDGWSKMGLQQFSTYYKLVSDDRNTTIGKNVEEVFMQSNRETGKGSSDGTEMKAHRKELSNETVMNLPNDWETMKQEIGGLDDDGCGFVNGVAI
jgi:hypothetical protein